MATMADVAREAGVSVATVSRLLNNLGVVSPETAARVYAAIEKLSYEPNLLARNLRKNESRVILILSPNITNPYYAHILSGIGDAAAELGYSALIFNTADDPARVREGLEMLKKHRADGAILMASDMNCAWLLEYADEYPLVQCSEYGPDVDIPHVSIDNYRATRDIMEYLIGLGHRRIAHISSENDYISTSLRLKGYRDALAEHGLTSRDDYIIYASRDYSFKSGKAKARELLAVEPRPTAIFCISDTLALGAITAVKEMGLRVPQDVTVIGFDDVEHTTMFHPYITTVAQPCYEMGKESARLLYALMMQEKQVPRQSILEHRLIVRESTSPPAELE
ncbi:transcriptional regulator, LacI family [Longilinea arvoryzae]|uniref:Transcriptional regulator, LacI family n=1 Tax=Longilinea arvoryzae TaxID=360412 RepID=A0A0S7B6B0_9CHLR|nr:LacI family DNA-binding transcriptional regulator [Longilinea arvoryzae]GAP12671.1 transcriptional regulator, LacI family [Longilinea arvoryzae]